MKIIYWVRNDLRLEDNLTLTEFLKDPDEKIFVWCETKATQRAGAHRRAFLDKELENFQLALKQSGLELLILKENFSSFLQKRTDVTSVYFTCGWSVEEKDEEEEILLMAHRNHFSAKTFRQGTLVDLKELPYKIQDMPFTFSDFRKSISESLLTHPALPVPAGITPVPSEGKDRIDYYVWKSKKILTYTETRNGMMNEDDTSRFSAWLANGMITPRMVMKELRAFEETHGKNESTNALEGELLWRDYFKFFTLKYGRAVFMEEGVRRGGVCHTIDDKNIYAKWCEGRTGVDFIDATMRELLHTGWITKRGRQNAASYLVHELKLPWIWGGQWFEKMLVDYDPELCWGNWLYLSGRGSDPRPSKLSIPEQVGLYDPTGDYRRRWL